MWIAGIKKERPILTFTTCKQKDGHEVTVWRREDSNGLGADFKRITTDVTATEGDNDTQGTASL